MKVVIIDDEKNAVISIELALKEFCPEVEVVGTAISPLEGIRLIREKKPDLVFLDIQMPHMSGIELLETLNDVRNFRVIFVTAFNEYAVKAFRLSATDYLLKPLSIVDLIDAVKKCNSISATDDSLSSKTEKLKAALSGKIALPSSHGTEFILINDIIRAEADGSYTIFHCLNCKPKLVSGNLKEFQKALDNESFLRIHKSHLINLKHIKKYSPVKDGGFIEMCDGSIAEVARTHKNELSGIIGSYLK